MKDQHQACRQHENGQGGAGTQGGAEERRAGGWGERKGTERCDGRWQREKFNVIMADSILPSLRAGAQPPERCYLDGEGNECELKQILGDIDQVRPRAFGATSYIECH